MNIIAVNLVALGVAVLVFSGMFFSTPGQPAIFPGVHLETTASHLVPLVVGALMVGGGVASLIVKPKRVV